MGFTETQSTERRRSSGPREASGWLAFVLLVATLTFIVVLNSR